MIKVTELRVGNLVLYKQDNDTLPVLKINGDEKKICLDLLMGLNMELEEEDIDPIPLNPEWLEMCEFPKGSNGIELSNDLRLIIHADKSEANLYDIYRNYTTQLKIHCQFVHQLQNLYFALTGDELEIKLP